MTSVGDHGLSCLDGRSYAAIALSMQANANATNDALAGIAASLASYANRYVFKTVSASSSTSGANSGIGLPDGTAADLILQPNLGALAQGWYGAAFSLSYQATGAVTALTYRRGLIMIVPGSGASVPPSMFQVINSETNTAAADSMTVNAWFYADGVSTYRVQAYFGHGNTGSTMTVAAGAALTVRYMASGLVT